ncbi:MAG: FAD-dependent oxidoreductase, partial [Desulfobacterales bacterium]|nr:FAD-dependent oxidoreductase [Desulfobacterales bacterium]
MNHQGRLVIVGAGIVGCAAAYHLTKLGWRDILVVDKGPLFENDGSTSHAPGGVVALSHSKLLTQMAQYSSKLYKSLRPFESGRNTYNALGGLEIAISRARMDDLVRLHGEAQAFGAEAVLQTPSEIQEKVPLINKDAIVGGLYAPLGAIVAGWHVSGALARDAAEGGAARFIADTMVTEIESKKGRVTAVRTANPEMPRIECEQVLLCNNIWGPVLGDQHGVPLPLFAYEHQYVISEPLPELAQFDRKNMADEIVWPGMRELDSAMYYRQHWDAYGVGSYRHVPRPVNPHAINGTAMHPFTPDDFGEAWGQAQKIVPALQDRKLVQKFNGMFAFSVDGYPIMGESRRIRGLWTAVASWITHAGGVAKSIAEWMTRGDTEWDMRQVNLHRFDEFQTTAKYISVVCNKNYREVYDIVHPSQPLSEPRNVRLTPYHPRTKALGASFTTFAGFEIPSWFENSRELLAVYDERIPKRTGWEAEYWSRIQGAEHLATRENAGMFDISGLCIIEISGTGAAEFVNFLCSNEMNKLAGNVVYTFWLTPGGGIRRDLTVARLGENRFWMFVGAGTLPQDLDWVRRHAPADGSVVVRNLSSAYSAIGLWGPNARRILRQAAHTDISNEAFPFYTSQWIEVGMSRVFAMRISYAGELGWELHIPVDQSLPVWDALWEAGRPYNLIAAGTGAFDSLRLEKGYRLWGRDIYTEYNPYQAGMGWTVKTAKPSFIGREACLDAKDKPPRKMLTCLTLEDPRAGLLGYEPILTNGRCIGHITSSNYGYAVGKVIAYGYLPAEEASIGTELEVRYMG